MYKDHLKCSFLYRLIARWMARVLLPVFTPPVIRLRQPSFGTFRSLKKKIPKMTSAMITMIKAICCTSYKKIGSISAPEGSYLPSEVTQLTTQRHSPIARLMPAKTTMSVPNTLNPSTVPVPLTFKKIDCASSPSPLPMPLAIPVIPPVRILMI